MIQVWLHKDEHNFLQEYSEKKLMTVSDLIRYWIRYTMKLEGTYKEPIELMQPQVGGGDSMVRKYIVKTKNKYYGYLYVQSDDDKITQTFAKYRRKQPQFNNFGLQSAVKNTPTLEMLARETTIFHKGDAYPSLEEYLIEIGVENPVEVTEGLNLTFRN